MWTHRTNLRTSVRSTINPQSQNMKVGTALCSEEFESLYPCSRSYNKFYCVCIMYQTVPIFALMEGTPYIHTHIHIYFPSPPLDRFGRVSLYFYFFCAHSSVRWGPRRCPLLWLFPFAGKAAAYFTAAEVTLTRDSISCSPAAVLDRCSCAGRMCLWWCCYLVHFTVLSFLRLSLLLFFGWCRRFSCALLITD